VAVAGGVAIAGLRHLDMDGFAPRLEVFTQGRHGYAEQDRRLPDRG